MNKQTIENAQVILNSFKEGQGKTFDTSTKFALTDKLSTTDGLTYNLNGAIVKFTNEAHKEAMFQMLFYKEHKDKAHEKVVDTFTYLSSGKYLSMNHRDANSIVKPATHSNIISEYPELEVLGFTSLTKAGRSSMYLLEKPANIDENDIKNVSALGFTDLTPTVAGLKIVLKLMLPVVEEPEVK